MAMAFLFSSLLRTHRGIKIADNPADTAFGIIIDHKIREESTPEASRVAQELKRLGVKAVIKPVNWKDATREGQEPGSLTNVESLARTLRYRMLGSTCSYLNATSLFFAHHRDDQYETVLMRHMSGHGYRGLQGIREANAIPECYDLHGVYKSGLLDDQSQRHPFLSFKPPNKEMKRLRWTLKDRSETDPWDSLRTHLGINDMSSHFPGHINREIDPRRPYLTPLNCEDGGISVYRPLLEFDKDRLIATCGANNVKWFEDPTNADTSLTPRNAIRHTDQESLPEHLRKPAILAMSRNAKKRVKLEEAEAQRWLTREAVIQDFDPNAGTMLIELPPIGTSTLVFTRRLHYHARRKARRPHERVVAATALRKMIGFVTPEVHAPSVANFDNVVDRLFPELSPQKAGNGEISAFSIAGIKFEPIVTPNSTKWYLTRAPYPSRKPLPERKLPGYLNYQISPLVGDKDVQPTRNSHWRTWKTAKLWDGRFWIRVSACVPARFHILPLLPQHVKPFRKALPPKKRVRFEQILRQYAPGKVRYSLPALYSVEATQKEAGANPILTLLALPSLGVHVPGLERWVKYEARYKRVDLSLLGLQKRGTEPNVPRPRWRHSRRIRRRASY